MEKDKKGIVIKTLAVLALLFVFAILCGIWALLLAVLFGICFAAVWLHEVFTKREEPEHAAPIPVKAAALPTERDVKKLAYSIILRRITELVTAEYPDARWVWEAPNAKQQIECGEDLFILLNRAGGYRRAKVNIRNLQVLGVEFRDTQTQDTTGSEEMTDDAQPGAEEQDENYELLAFEWVDAHIIELNERCNEAIGNGITELLLQSDELPVPDSWPDICRELERADIKEAAAVPEGIKINLLQ